MLYVYTDGASRGNPGESASGYCVLDDSHKILQWEVAYNGICTNNIAEYKAVIMALNRVLKEWGSGTALVLHSDSKLMINQLAGNYKIKNLQLKKLKKEAGTLLKKFKKHELLNVRRENRYVSLVDKELNDFLDKKTHNKV